MIERITPENPLTERHVGMMAVLRNGDIFGRLRQFSINKNWFCLWSNYEWQSDGSRVHGGSDLDIIAVMPMPDLSGLGGE